MSSLSDSFRKTLERLFAEDVELLRRGATSDADPEVAVQEREQVTASLRLLALSDELRDAHLVELRRLARRYNCPLWRVEGRSVSEDIEIARTGLDALDNAKLAAIALSPGQLADLESAILAAYQDGTLHASWLDAMLSESDRREREFGEH